MTQETGRQYDKDHRIDPTGFLARARWHQSVYRAGKLTVPPGDYGNYLQEADAQKGLNFYDDFEVFDAVKQRYHGYIDPLYANMLRSEHIPFNLFIPFRSNPDYAMKVFNNLFGGGIASINQIKIEYAPSPSSMYLDDKTSFDSYIEYTHSDGRQGIIGIEVKYTEQGYTLSSGSKQEREIQNKESIYYRTSVQCGLFNPDDFDMLASDRFRQIWRNHLLGESMLIVAPDKYAHFTSMIVFPEGNLHFVEASKEYMAMLQSNDLKFLPVTYEQFLVACQKHVPDQRFQRWIDYLRVRYIVG